MENLKKIIDDFVQKNLNYLFLIFFTILFSTSIYAIAGFLIIDTGYPVSRLIFLKNILYLGMVASIAGMMLFKDLKGYITIPVIYIVICHGIIVILGILGFNVKQFYQFSQISLVVLIVCLLLIVKKNLNLFNQSNRLYLPLLYLICIAGILAPLTVPRYLNSESYVQPTILGKYLPENEHRILKNKVYKEDQINLILQRDHMLSGVGFYRKSNAYVLEREHDGLLVKHAIGPDLSTFCLFLSPKRQYEEKDLTGCNNILGVNSKNNFYEKYDYINQALLIDESLKQDFIMAIDREEIFSDSMAKEFSSLGALMTIRGYLFHHYNSILEGFISAAESYWNQYGIGPISLVKVVSKVFNISNFDALYLSIPIFNAIAFLVLIGFFGGRPIVIFAFAVSLFCTFLVSNIFAPFLYQIRVLPYLIYIIYLVKINEKSHIRFYGIFNLIGIFVCGIYNKEYALILFFALIGTGIFAKSRFYVASALSLFALISSLNLLFPAPNIHGANFLALIYGVGFDGNIRPEFFIFLIMLFGVIYSFFNLQKNRVTKELIFLLLCILGFSIKFITNPSINHIGWIFILIAIYYVVLDNHSYNAVNGKFLFVAGSLGMLLLTLPAYVNSNYFERYKNVEYVNSGFSSLFKLDSGLSEKLKSTLEFKQYNYCLISKQDDVISIQNNRVVTAEMPNLSTNVNHYKDVKKTINMYSNCEYILVDKDLLRQNESDYLKLNIYNRDQRLNRFISGYLNDFHKMQYTAFSSIDGRKLLKSNQFFDLYQ